MGKDIKLRLDDVTRIEGHGRIVVTVKDGAIEEARFDVAESPRFFEVMLQGRPYGDAAWISARICGICAVSHTLASLRATEDAFGVLPSLRTRLLRELIMDGEVMQSHVLHLYFLVAPDLFGAGSVVPLAATHSDVVKRALRLKKLANDLCAVVGGRHVHPVSMEVNGFTKLPDRAALLSIQQRLADARADVDATVSLFKTLRFPDFERETEYISLEPKGRYEFISGDIMSSDGYVVPYKDYLEGMKETVLPTSSAKHVRARRGSFMVGALARFNNGHAHLHEKARRAASELGLAPPCHNPFMTNAAQLVETVHCLEDSIALIDQIAGLGPGPEDAGFTPSAGRGVGIVEAPRGLLVHDYSYGADGRMAGANCIIPTGQNLANIDQDIRAFLPSLLQKDEEELKKGLKMLVRAYDPCISCSTHDIKISYTRKT